MNHPYLIKLIEQGEGRQLDFKFAVNDSRKIARSLAAFANTAGGILLIGVKDNGNIAGVRSEEEFYMLDAAAQMYTRPVVEFTTNEWNSGGKKVLEVHVLKSSKMPHQAPGEDGNWCTYLRVDDKNILAKGLVNRYFKWKSRGEDSFLRYGDQEKLLLETLQSGEYSISELRKTLNIPRPRVENILLSLMLMNVVVMDYSKNPVLFRLGKTGVKL